MGIQAFLGHRQGVLQEKRLGTTDLVNNDLKHSTVGNIKLDVASKAKKSG